VKVCSMFEKDQSFSLTKHKIIVDAAYKMCQIWPESFKGLDFVRGPI